MCVHRRLEVHKHVQAGRLAILVGQAGSVIGSEVWDLAFVTRNPVDFNVFYRGGSAVLPAYLVTDSEVARQRKLFGGKARQVTWLMWLLAALFVARYAFLRL